MIKVKGKQVAPAELEAHLLSHPEVGDCAVIGVPDERAGEIPRAYIVANANDLSREASHTLEKDIVEYVRKYKDSSMWLDAGGVEFVSSVPKSPSGKILRSVLMEQVARTARSKL